MPGIVPPSLTVTLYDILESSQVASVDTPGQVLQDVLGVLGGLTTAGLGTAPNTAQLVTWVAVGTGTQAFSAGLTTLANEVARVPVVGSALAGASQLVCALLGAREGWGWLTEVGVFGGSATATLGSGTLYAYCPLALPRLKNGSKNLNLQWSAQ